MATKPRPPKPNRTATHQVNLRLTDSQLQLFQSACEKYATDYGTPSVAKFILVEALAAAHRVTGK